MNRRGLLVLAVTLASSALALAVSVALAAIEPLGVAPAAAVALVLAAVVGEVATISGDPEEAERTFSLSTSLHLALAMLMAPGWAALAAGVATAAGEAVRRQPAIRVAFNSGVALTCTLAAAAVFEAIAPSRTGLAIYPALLAALAAYVVLQTVPVGAIHAAVAEEPFRPGALLPPADLIAYVMEACVGALIAVLVVEAPSALALLAPLVVAVFLALERYRALRRETRQTLRALASAIDARDPYTAAHSERVGTLAAELAAAAALPEGVVRDARWAGRLHDLGKVAVPDAVLFKPGRLDEEEWTAMRRHPGVSADLISPLSLMRRLQPAVRMHHERMDGAGYYRVPGPDVPVVARLVAIADSYDAMTTDRPYRSGLSEDEALRRIEEAAGSQFDEQLAAAFVALRRGEPVPRYVQARPRRGVRQALAAWPMPGRRGVAPGVEHPAG